MRWLFGHNECDLHENKYKFRYSFNRFDFFQKIINDNCVPSVKIVIKLLIKPLNKKIINSFDGPNIDSMEKQLNIQNEGTSHTKESSII